MASWRVTAANGAGLRCASSVSSAIMCRAYRGEVLRARDAVAGDAGWACVVKPGYGLLWALRRDLERTDAPPSPAPAEPPAPPAPPTPPPRRWRQRRRAPAPRCRCSTRPGTASCARSAPRRPSGPRARRGGRASPASAAPGSCAISDLHTDMAENATGSRATRRRGPPTARSTASSSRATSRRSSTPSRRRSER
ncbi:hypothetical protein JL720_15817 [Aureococcus anophagefferens]|nr:hypothetical protein JL720_15817 [Aureococcus anophagefferens]